MTTPKPIDHLTPEELRVIAESLGIASRFVLMKRGLYYRPNGHGYTDRIEEAWILSGEEADKHVYPHDEPVTKHLAPLPAFATDANAALTLAHALAKDGWTRSGWRTADGPENAVFGRGDKGHAATASGPHAFELALCRAYLAVVRAGKEQG